MTPVSAFILGLLVGWLVEWIIDWLYWRRRRAALQLELDQTKSRLATAEPESTALEGQLAALKTEFVALQQKSAGLEADNAALNQQLSALSADKSSLAEQLEACQARVSMGESHQVVEAPGMPAEVPAPAVAGVEAPTVRMAAPISLERDDLEIIKGIGPVINRKLNQAGIYTFKQLAEITPARLVELVGDVIQRLADEETILAQARELADKKEGGG